MKKIMMIIDPQFDFVFGVLRNEIAILRLPKLRMMLEYARDNGFDEVIVTRDTHYRETYLKTQEGRNLPIIHCVFGEDGWQVCKEILVDGIKYTYINKSQYGTIDYKEHIADAKIIVMGGFDTEYCVISNFVNARTLAPEAIIYVVSDAIAGATPEMHEKALDVISTLNGKVMVWEDVVKELEKGEV